MEEKTTFEDAVKRISSRGGTYKADGYRFLREALDYTVGNLRKEELIEHRHVTGQELLEGLVEYAHREFGSMSVSVLDSWGIRSGEDVGRMVFQLIEENALGRSEEDSPNDFIGVLDLRTELLAPYRPTGKVRLRSSQNDLPEPPARGNQPAKSKEI